MRARTILALAALGALVAFAPEAAAQQREKPKPAAAAPTGFSDAERKTIADYFAKHEYDAEALPPGIARNLAKGKPLPPGIAKKAPPAELTAQLPEREGLEVRIFGDRVVLLEASGLVVDIVEGIFR